MQAQRDFSVTMLIFLGEFESIYSFFRKNVLGTTISHEQSGLPCLERMNKVTRAWVQTRELPECFITVTSLYHLYVYLCYVAIGGYANKCGRNKTWLSYWKKIYISST